MPARWAWARAPVLLACSVQERVRVRERWREGAAQERERARAREREREDYFALLHRESETSIETRGPAREGRDRAVRNQSRGPCRSTVLSMRMSIRPLACMRVEEKEE
jgi:hypothetical protein